mmetsp:Transcript_22593/g.50486  ORF Transcript_22593/g.50486 Transcript_22593/m.50486 type:complete len:263 (+) Transcript_22593:221-1009(+)
MTMICMQQQQQQQQQHRRCRRQRTEKKEEGNGPVGFEHPQRLCGRKEATKETQGKQKQEQIRGRTTTTTTATTTTRRPLKSNTSDNASNNNETPGDHRRDFLVGLLVRTPLAVTARACAATPGPPGAVAATPPPIDDNASDRLLSETYGDVLELRGVGTGRERAIAACTGVDISPAAIDRARRRFETGGDDDPSPVSPALLEELYKNDKVRCFETGDDDDEDDLEGLLSSVGSEPQKFDVVVVVVVDGAGVWILVVPGFFRA